jgi:D-alanyl-D-alanine dipeptidase
VTFALAAALIAGLVASTKSSTGAGVLVDVAELDPRFRFDIRYATEDNFTKKRVYPEARCLIRKEVAPKLIKAQRWLDEHHAGLHLLFKDCYRPDHIQRVLWNVVKGTGHEGYVADPNTPEGSVHNYGAAVDATLVDDDGVELDMGTPFDHLGNLAQPRFEEKYMAEGQLTKAQVDHRHILRAAMRHAHLYTIPNEWWHFEDGRKEKIRKKWPRLDVPFSSVPRGRIEREEGNGKTQ